MDGGCTLTSRDFARLCTAPLKTGGLVPSHRCRPARKLAFQGVKTLIPQAPVAAPDCLLTLQAGEALAAGEPSLPAQ